LVKVLYAIVIAAGIAYPLGAQAQNSHAAAMKQFNQLCAGCHGENGMGGDRAPALLNNPDLRMKSEAQIHDLIKTGLPGGMPAFDLPEPRLKALAAWLKGLNPAASDTAAAGNVAAGQQFFFAKGGCAGCHMVHGQGSTNGPDLSDIGLKRTTSEIEAVLDNPTSQMGIHTTASCPSYAFCPDLSWAVVDVRLKDGAQLRGFARHRSEHSLQLQDFDGRIHLLSESDYVSVTQQKQSYMPALEATKPERRDLIAYLSTLVGPVLGPLPTGTKPVSAKSIENIANPKPGEWPTYNGALSGNRYSELAQVNVENVHALAPRWIYSLGAPGLQSTPVVADGVMYATAPGKVCAIDAGSGAEIWCHTLSAENGEPNRGVALLGDRIFYTGSGAQLICLNRLTGGVMWTIKMANMPGPYSATGAPLVVGDLVISGVSGGDLPLRGFVAAYNVVTGQEVWRFWTIPAPGEPAADTWNAKSLATGGGATWLTGSYDKETDTLFWTVGNPFPATDGDPRGKGRNLYTDSVVALDPKNGKLKWHYQFTPHDLHDWDAVAPLLLVDAPYKGQPRKLLLQANRNGFFYVLDRTNGELLLAKPFVKKLNWASGIGPDGVPQLLPANDPTSEGVKTCPAVRGATNWYSSSFNPQSRLFYVMAVEDCSIYKIAHMGGYEGYRDPSDPGTRSLRALDIHTGKIVWEVPQVDSPEADYSGILSTAGGLVFYGESSGNFAAVDAKTGKTLWHFMANDPWKASPMTYLFKGRQYVAIASGGNILSFALPQPQRSAVH
jgi:PQQ-dependent dehydrogenase (methanol/ethanol family)